MNIPVSEAQVEAGARALAERRGKPLHHWVAQDAIREEAALVLTAAAEATQAETPATRCDHGCATVTAACLMDSEARIIKAETPTPADEPSDTERLSQDELAAISWCISYVAKKGGFSQLSSWDAPPVKFADLNAKIGKIYERREVRRG